MLYRISGCYVKDFKWLKKIELAGKGDKIKGFTVEYLGAKKMDVLVKKCSNYRFLAKETEAMPKMVLNKAEFVSTKKNEEEKKWSDMRLSERLRTKSGLLSITTSFTIL